MSPGLRRGFWPWLSVAVQIFCLSVWAEPDCSVDQVNNEVIITVFGQTGKKGEERPQDAQVTECSLQDCPENQQTVAQWILSTILRSMLQENRNSGGNEGSPDGEEEISLGEEAPDVRVSVIPPFQEDKWVPGGTDQLSPFYRTNFRFVFSKLDQASARKAAMNLCKHYKRIEEELLKGIQRALTTFGMRPWEAAERAAENGLSMSSFIHLSSSVASPGCDFVTGAGCGWDAQERADTRDGAFFLPACPENSRRKAGQSKPWECHCIPGYSGSITYAFLTDRERNVYDGTCELEEGFCKGNYTMELESGSPARGVLGEVARARCPEGYESTGTGKCISADDRGVWSPSGLCKETIPPLCTHDFDSPLATNVKVDGACDNCRAGQDCDCAVKCKDGTERFGGGSEDGRSCQKDKLHMDPPPLCLPKPTCKNVTAPEVAEVESCGKVSDRAECLVSMEADKPCCYLSSGLCAAKESSAILWDQPPEDCSPPPATKIEHLPVCETKCKNRFTDVKNIEYSSGCDSCTTAMSKEDCLCDVTCKKPAKMPHTADTETYPPEGRKRCLARASSVGFEAPPVCLEPCKSPGDDSGTLDLSKCQVAQEGSECFPGVPGCGCEVSCAEGFRQIEGGRSGSKFGCGTDGSFVGLPVCRPLCEQPDDQKGLLDVSACTSCIAGDADCKCELKCAANQKRMGGGPEGKYVCALLAGEDGSAATGAWAVADPDQRKALGEQGLQVPSCLSPIFVEVVSATTKKSMEGVSINVIRGKRSLGTSSTPADGKAILDMVGYEPVTILASKDGYARVKRSFERADCTDPNAQCGLRLSMSEVLQHGKIVSEGCYFKANSQKPEWEMRAVLGWRAKPNDLDIWARNLDCFEDTAVRHGCGNGAKETCARSKFMDTKVRKVEGQQCATYKLRSHLGVTALEPSGKFSRKRLFANQFPKWLFHHSARAMDKMDKRINANSGAVEQIKTSMIRSVTLKGFPDVIDSRYCNGQACSELLDGVYVERQGQQYLVSGRETYWRGSTTVMFYCGAKDAWFLAIITEAEWGTLFNGDCQGLASTDTGVDVLDPSKVAFPYQWNQDTKAFDKTAKAGVTRIHHPTSEQDLPWNADHHMFLNVDQREGFGPETISFKNVPPGVYQIVVNTYTPVQSSWHMREAGAMINIYVGPGDDPLFHCRIHRECQNASMIWNVVNVEVFDGGIEVNDQGAPTGETRYYLRARESPSMLSPIYDTGLPTEMYSNRAPAEDGQYGKFAGEKYYNRMSNYDNRQLQTSCHGRCEPAPGHEQCLYLPPGAHFPYEDSQ